MRANASHAAALGAVLLGGAAVALPAAALGGGAGWWLAVAGSGGVLAAGWGRTRWLSGLAPLAAVATVVLSASAGALSLPAAAVVGVLLLGHVLAVDLLAALDQSHLPPGELRSWIRAAGPLAAAGGAGALATTAVLAVPWPATAAVVLLAPAALAAAALVAVAGHQVRR